MFDSVRLGLLGFPRLKVRQLTGGARARLTGRMAWPIEFTVVIESFHSRRPLMEIAENQMERSRNSQKAQGGEDRPVNTGLTLNEQRRISNGLIPLTTIHFSDQCVRAFARVCVYSLRFALDITVHNYPVSLSFVGDKTSEIPPVVFDH